MNYEYISDDLKFESRPKAKEESVVLCGEIRVTVLTDRLFRVEYDSEKIFEDRASMAIWFRDQKKVDFSVDKKDGVLRIKTKEAELSYIYDESVLDYEKMDSYKNEVLASPFLEKLSVKRNDGSVWKYGNMDADNLLGTHRTLDGANGELILESGLISRSGFALLDDSNKPVFNEHCWIEERGKDEAQDIYIFAYGDDYYGALSDYCLIAGKMPMLPRYLLGNWWSRYWDYSDEEVLGLADEFKAHGVPLSVFVIDMDWHIVENEYHGGWTGYSWDKKLFPNPKEFLKKLHDKGVRITLNLHPALGIYPHEDCYEEMAKFMGIEPKTKEPIEFDCTDAKFVRGYFDICHHPLENEGVDFWWMDWQQGNKTKVPGVDPLWWLNHLHYYDSGRGGKRPFVFSRWGGFGNHRYPIGFSGDAIITWESLQFQPYFTSAASNVGYGWWSHDIGGHMGGSENPQRYLRWVQYGVFSPIMRLHSTKSYELERRPWGFDDERVEKLGVQAMRLRCKLLPYIYSMNYRVYSEDKPFITPMYYEHPKNEEAYFFTNQYYFGSELIASPYITPLSDETSLSRVAVWLPETGCYNFFTSEKVESGVRVFYGGLEDIPVFAKQGAIIPMNGDIDNFPNENSNFLDIKIFAGADNSFNLYEDDGITENYKNGDYCLTKLSLRTKEKDIQFSIENINYKEGVIPEKRKYALRFMATAEPKSVLVLVDEREVDTSFEYSEEDASLLVMLYDVSVTSKVNVSLSFENSPVYAKDKTEERLLTLIKSMNIDYLAKKLMTEDIKEFIENPFETIRRYKGELNDEQIRMLLEGAGACGYEVVSLSYMYKTLAIWNNKGLDGVEWKYSGKKSTLKHSEYQSVERSVKSFDTLKDIKTPSSWHGRYVHSLGRYLAEVSFSDVYKASFTKKELD